MAFAAGLPGEYKAWLADTTAASAPDQTFFRAPGGYRLVDGTVVADDWFDLTDGTLQHAISKDEFGGNRVGLV